MNPTRIVTAAYSALTRLYPPEYRAEFGSELRGVFASMVEQAARRGRWPLAAVCLRELRDLPLHLAREHFDNLRKGVAMNEPLLSPRSINTSIGGGIGFGTGFALVVLVRALVDPANSMLFEHFEFGLLRETFLLALAGALGGVSIAIGSRSPRQIRILAITGALSCGLSGGLGTVFKTIVFRLGLWDYRPGSLSYWLISLTAIAFIGAVMGAALSINPRSWRPRFSVALMGAAGFVIANVFAFSVLHPMIRSVWVTPVWQPPQVLSALAMGLFGGAVLGWAAGRSQANPAT